MIKERLAKLIDLKSIITLAMTTALIYGFVVVSYAIFKRKNFE